MSEAEEDARIFGILSAATRVRILGLLRGRALCVNALARRLGISAAAVSQHLRVLRGARLVTARRRGYHVHYRLDERTMARWRRVADGVLRPGPPRRARCTEAKGGRPCVTARASARSRTS